MAINRRSFIGISTLAACGATLAPAIALGGAAPRALRGGLPLWSGDEAALKFVKGYASQIRIIGASVLGRIRSSGLRALHVLAEVPDLAKLDAALAAGGVGEIYSEDNVISFTVGETQATVENLTPEVFAARLAALGKRATHVLAHDALVYDPATQEVSDPFAARTTGVRVINKALGGAAALAVLLRGTTEAGQLGLPASADFTRWKAAVLRLFARPVDARKIAETFLSHVAVLAERLPRAAFVALLKSRLISSALMQVFGINTASAIAEFQALREQSGAEITDAALWLKVLIAPEIDANEAVGAATTWISSGDRFQNLRSRKALGQAQKLF